jgi:hypothetical protein
MIEQITTEFRAFRQKMTLIMLILPYILFIGMGVIFKYAFVAIFIGMIVSFITFISMTTGKLDVIKQKIKSVPIEESQMKIERSYNKNNIVLYLLWHTFAIFVLSFIAEFDAVSTFASIISLIFIGIPILTLNSEIVPVTLNTTPGSSPYKEDEYRFKEYPGERKEINDLWYRDVCLPGNPIFVPPPDNSNW